MSSSPDALYEYRSASFSVHFLGCRLPTTCTSDPNVRLGSRMALASDRVKARAAHEKPLNLDDLDAM